MELVFSRWMITIKLLVNLVIDPFHLKMLWSIRYSHPASSLSSWFEGDLRLPLRMITPGQQRRCKWRCTCRPASPGRRTRTCGWRWCSRRGGTGRRRRRTSAARGCSRIRTPPSPASSWASTRRICSKRRAWRSWRGTPTRGCWRSRSCRPRWRLMSAGN